MTGKDSRSPKSRPPRRPESATAETDQTPVYLELFHGRKDPIQEMDDWGEPGPIFECQYVHTTYANDIKMGDNCPADLYIRHSMIYYDGLWYGDWSAFVPSAQFRESEEFKRRLQPFDPEKAKLPEPAAGQEQRNARSKVQADLSKVDWALLRKQKEALIIAAAVAAKRQPPAALKQLEADAFEGLLNLLDHLQDAAARTLGEETVFGPPQELAGQQPRKPPHVHATLAASFTNKISE